MLAEVLGPAEFRDRVKIYATDVDEEALAQARQAAYTEREVRGIPAELLERYFDQTGGRYVFRKDLRRSVIFGRNDLVQDAPISRIDLLVCRNTLMYFNAETQARILARFHFALARAGVLFLGKAEMLLGHGTLFAPVDLKRRIFRKASRELPQAATAAGRAGAAAGPWPSRPGWTCCATRRCWPLRWPRSWSTADGVLALANRQAEQLFGLVRARRRAAVPRPRDLLPPARAAPPHRAGAVRTAPGPGHRRGAATGGGEAIRLESGRARWSTARARLARRRPSRSTTSPTTAGCRTSSSSANRELETAYEELQSTNEELETTNEELQSTVEELETTNEELQSTNEELETMNEELQSTNEELQTINDELQDRTRRARRRQRLPGVHPDQPAGRGGRAEHRSCRCRSGTGRPRSCGGCGREEAVGQHFLNLDIGLPIDRLRPLIRRTLADEDGSQEAIVDAVNRRGRTIEVRVLGSALRAITGEVAGIILTMEGVENSAERSPAAPDSGVG